MLSIPVQALAEGQRLMIEIRPGVYKERVIVPQDRPRTTFLARVKNENQELA